MLCVIGVNGLHTLSTLGFTLLVIQDQTFRADRGLIVLDHTQILETLPLEPIYTKHACRLTKVPLSKAAVSISDLSEG